MLRGVLFDMDGVIIDSEPYHYEIETGLFETLGIHLSESERLSFVGLSSRSMWELIRGRYKLPLSAESLVDMDRQRRISFFRSLDRIVPIKGVPELLQMLASAEITTALASSSPEALIDIIITRLGFAEHFAVRVSGDSVAAGKPAPDIFLRAAAMLGLDPSECLVIEDSTHGIKAAISAGMKCAAYIGPGETRRDVSGSDITFHDFTTVTPELLKGLFR